MKAERNEAHPVDDGVDAPGNVARSAGEAPSATVAAPRRASIIVPAHDCWELTRACVDSIRRHTAFPYELLLVDDASQPSVAEKMKGLENENTRVIRNDERRTYSANNNAAARTATGDVLCLLNNDTLVTPGWLRAMVQTLDRHPRAGIVGNRHLFPDSESLHHCGMAFDKNGYPQHLHPHTDPQAPAVNYEREASCVTFACVLIRTALYHALGGLDEAFRNGFEDCDFCLRAQAAGHRILYTPASVIYHYGQASAGRTDYDDANWKRFDARWHGKTPRDFETRTTADRAWNRKMKSTRHRAPGTPDGIHFAINFSSGGAFTWAAADLIVALERQGADVSVAPALRCAGIDGAKRRMLRRLMRKKPRTACHVKWSHYWDAMMRTPLKGDLNVELFCTNYRYARDPRRLDLWMRHVQVSAHRWLPVSGFNREALLDVGIPAEKCMTVPLGYAPEVDVVLAEGLRRPGPDDPLQLLVVTNSDDLERYGTDIAIRALGRAFGREKGVVVHIKDYGAHSGSRQLRQWIAAQPDFPEVRWHTTFVDKVELMKLYAGMHALVAPFRGEGFGMKIIDAMALGVPVVMPCFGGPADYAKDGAFLPLSFRTCAVGDCYDMRHHYVGEGATWCEVEEDSLVDALRGLRDRPRERVETGERAADHVRSHYTWDRAARDMLTAVRMWSSERASVIAPRLKPSCVPLSVIIPTVNRTDLLAQALEAYRAQEVSPEQYEILIVNDHGDLPAVRKVADDHSPHLTVDVLDNPGARGPAAARNLAIERARGHIVLITGDDIVPGKHFLAAHLEMHRQRPNEQFACVGNTQWHPDIPSTPFMQHLSGEGGQQFNYRDARHNRVLPFDRFYTSNVSLKRTFLAQEELLFRTVFRFAAYEDIELAYRLHLRGMQLVYSQTAVGYHHHAMTPDSFLERQHRVGRMLTLLCLVQPSYVPEEHAAILKSLEFARGDAAVYEYLRDEPALSADGDPLIDGLVHNLSRILNVLPTLRAPERSGVRASNAAAHAEWFNRGCGTVWDAINELILRDGMAEEWAQDAADATWARAWVRIIQASAVLRGGAERSFSEITNPPRSILDGLHAAHRAYVLLQRLKSTPILGPGICRMEQGRLAEMLKMALKR